MIDQKYIDRFNSKYVVAPDGCWTWNAGKDKDGYGRFNVAQGPGRWTNVAAHRFSWTIQNGAWPSDKPVARHLCNNPSCVNPKHIQPGTQKENAADCYAAGRQSKNFDNICRIVQCPHCDKRGGLGIMKRWHFDNCKYKGAKC